MYDYRRAFAEQVIRLIKLLVIGGRVALMAFWLFVALALASFGHWIVDILAALSALAGVVYAYQTCEAYIEATPQQRPDELQRHLENNLLHHPRNPVDPRRRRRQRDHDYP